LNDKEELLEDSPRTFSPKKRAKNLVYYDSREEELRLQPGLVHISSPSTASKSLCPAIDNSNGIESMNLEKDVALEICSEEVAPKAERVKQVAPSKGRKKRKKNEAK